MPILRAQYFAIEINTIVVTRGLSGWIGQDRAHTLREVLSGLIKVILLPLSQDRGQGPRSRAAAKLNPGAADANART